MEDLTPAIVRKFLEHVESVRGCSGVTLATVHSLAKFIGMRSPHHIAWATEIRAIPFKKVTKNLIGYLEKTEMDALLKSPDRRTELGNRDYAILLFLYNSGARADEAAGLLIGDLHLKPAPAVRIVGKGKKHRLCPLWPTTVSALSRLIAGRGETEPVFLGRRHERMTRFGIHRLVREVGIEIRTFLGREACQPTLGSPHHSRPSTPLGRGHQHHPGVAGSCFARHYPRVRGG